MSVDSDAPPVTRGEVITAWQTSLVRRGLAPTTSQQWTYTVRHWWDFVGEPKVWRATFRDVERFMDRKPSTAQSRRNYVVALHAFYRWARRSGLCRIDPTLDVERPKVVPGLPRPIPDADLALGLALADPIVRAAMLLAATSGLRCIEMARLRWENVDEMSMRVHGKGNKWRVVPIHPDARDALMELERRDDGRVFPGITQYTQRAYVGAGISKLINRHLRGVGINATAHQLRHWCATKALAQSHDLRAVQELLGHAGPNTTAIYARLDPTRLRPIVHAIEVPGMPGRTADSPTGAPSSVTAETARTAIARAREHALRDGRLVDADELERLGDQLLAELARRPQ